jgi:hypothetical protein
LELKGFERCFKEIEYMDTTRKLGILVFFGVPAIIGGGVVYHFFGDYTPVIIYEMILALFAGGIIGR